jgi:Protein of unknown function (DUF664)
VIDSIVLAPSLEGLRFADSHGFIEIDRYVLPSGTIPAHLTAAATRLGLKELEGPERDRVASAAMTTPVFAATAEREALCGFLDLQRAALIRKVKGVGDADARQAPTASSLSLLGLLKHCTLWERRWFQNIVAGRSFPGEFPELEVPEGEMDGEDFRVDERDTVEDWLASFSQQASISRQITAERDLDAPCAWPPLAHRSLRWVLLHMIEETARHAGHADIIRETLDGSRGI